MSDKAGSIQVYPIKVHSQSPAVEDMAHSVGKAVDTLLNGSRSRNLQPGASVAVTAGSRGIANYVEILRCTVSALKARGFQPFVFAAMGTHGRGEAEGQREILDSMGMTENVLGCPVSCSSEVEQIDEFDAFGRRIPVYCAKEALQADGIVVVNRVKPHTSFRGEYESGLLKMMTVGMGRAKGADMFHSLGATHLADMIPLIGGSVLRQAPVIGGLAVLENAKEQTTVVEGIPDDRIMEREKALLELAKSFMPRLPVDKADLLIVGEMGKNYSGTGMDTNIIGRMRIQGVPEPANPFFTYIGVLRLSEPSHGNATGIGLADMTTQTLVDDIDKTAMYLNCATSGFIIRAAVPMTFAHDRALIAAAVDMLRIDDTSQLRMLLIRSTLHIEHLWVSEAVYEEVKNEPHIELTDDPKLLAFDEAGNLIW
ncbi:DUF362 domain-containing protein [Paenibacillus xerothermodurans]|nr:DUF362 domain-containing protein [Paenibacillus xerothermodurans]